MNLLNTQLCKSFKSKTIIKVITGIDNNDISQIIQIARAAEISYASYLDVIANPKIVKLLKSFSSLPICVSSINPIDIYNCVSVGADMIEIGNYNFFYQKGIYLGSSEIIELVQEIKSLIGKIDICVTIPYYLDLNQQVTLAQKLELLGINLLQTEGVFVPKDSQEKNSLLNHLTDRTNLYSLSLLSTCILSNYVSIPIITSSGVNSLSANIAKFYGASGVGIGSAITKQDNIYSMVKYINEVYYSLVKENNSEYMNKLSITNLFKSKVR
uniref:Uncharacterized protein ycf23 n=1 Tax=Rhodomela confervoides TaxID=35163 RepID=A0A1Z1M9R6_RHOCN|nr:hypothetical protein [Rhodomela confervoides]ARW62643.1 hypothetical protein [Rhodomela confervoides]